MSAPNGVFIHQNEAPSAVHVHVPQVLLRTNLSEVEAFWIERTTHLNGRKLQFFSPLVAARPAARVILNQKPPHAPEPYFLVRIIGNRALVKFDRKFLQALCKHLLPS